MHPSTWTPLRRAYPSRRAPGRISTRSAENIDDQQAKEAYFNMIVES